MQARTVVCMSFSGTSVSDNPAPLAREMKAQGIVDQVVWAVADMSLEVAPGEQKIAVHSSEFIEVIHRAKYLINNAHFPHYFRKRDGQFYLQTWHGTPLKRIANDVPPASLSDSYVDLMRRETEYWDLLFAQSPLASEILTAAFGYRGEVLSHGYPRNDVLLDKGALVARRTATRERLGIPPEAPVVLYAPTWRDGYQHGIAAESYEALDTDMIVNSLGEPTRILVRGHSNTLERSRNIFGPMVLDVSSLPDLEGLIAASDLLITDYSSIFFDYMLTGKPILGFVPDLKEYSSTVRGLYFDYGELFPGPVARSNEELSELLCDLQPPNLDKHPLVSDVHAAERGTATKEACELLIEKQRGLS